MKTAVDRLCSLTVSDVMSRTIVSVDASQRMEEAAEVLSAHDMSSAPVLNEQGHCVGMLSAADYLDRDGCGEGQDGEIHRLVQSAPSDALQIMPAGDSVASFMTTAFQSVAPNEPLLNAANMMCAEHIHHLPVIEGNELLGMVSALDVIAATINALTENAIEFLRRP